MEYGLIGEHLGHSFSAIIHGKIAPYQYELKELTPSDLHSFMQKKNFKAINVTIPYKQAVIPYLDEIEENAKKIGAVNTIVNRDGKLIGYNTDFLGMKALATKIGVSLEGKKVLILGSGGTSRTANAVATSLGAKQVLTVSRKESDNCITYEKAYTDHSDAEYIINTTPIGMYPNQDGNDIQPSKPIDLTAFTNLKGTLDAIFNPLRTDLICHARNNNIPADGGLYMLVAQAVYAAEKFLDRDLDKTIIDQIYSELRSQKENIVLIGMPGCGKSTVGKHLADQLNRPFFDVDDEIVKKAGIPIPEIFEKYGEAYFRQLEADIIKNEISAKTGSIISTGGGAILRDENVLRLKRNGKLYFLDRPIENIRPTLDRPLSMDFSALKKRYDERYPRYCEVADLHIKTNESIDDTVNYIKEDFFS